MNGNKILIHPAGHYDAINANLEKREIWHNGISSAIEKLITLQSKATPESVALPIDIMVLTLNGIRWVCPAGKCYLKYIKKY